MKKVPALFCTMFPFFNDAYVFIHIYWTKPKTGCQETLLAHRVHISLSALLIYDDGLYVVTTREARRTMMEAIRKPIWAVLLVIAKLLSPLLG